MYFILNVCYIPFIPLSSKSSAEEMEEMSFFHFLPPVRKKVISSGRNSTLPYSMQNKLGMDKIQGSHKLEWLYVLFPVRIYFTSSKKGNGLPVG